MAKANVDRVLKDLYTLREFGAYKAGVHRPTLSEDDVASRRWLASELQKIGHDAVIDGVANVFGRAPGNGPHILSGSHIETQNHAGWLDGALGVIYALEAARAVAEDPALEGRGVDVIAFADEEGHFSGNFSFLGSESFIGKINEDLIDAATDRSGRGSLRDMLDAAGLKGQERVRMEQDRYRAFVEAHIEQGNRLESEGFRIGVVTSIVGIWQYRILFEGAQNHAGTTTMATRRDAGKAMMQLWSAIEAAFPNIAGPDSVWTVGSATLDPSQPSVIPGKAEMIFQFRDADRVVLDRLHAKLMDLVADIDKNSPCSATIEVVAQSEPAVMADSIRQVFVDAATTVAPAQFRIMPSGAGHDAQMMAPLMPSGMMFIPSIGGVSHHWSENTSDEDIALGAEVFVEAVSRILRD